MGMRRLESSADEIDLLLRDLRRLVHSHVMKSVDEEAFDRMRWGIVREINWGWTPLTEGIIE